MLSYPDAAPPFHSPFSMTRFFPLLLPFVLLFGCAKAVPDGFPPLARCSVTVTDAGTPVAGCVIRILPEPRLDSVVVVGRTDQQGRATLRTSIGSSHRAGVPAGTLRMILIREPAMPHFKSEEEREAMTDRQGDAYMREVTARHAKLPRIVPPVLSSPNTTPLQRRVEPDQSLDWTVDLAEFR